MIGSVLSWLTARFRDHDQDEDEDGSGLVPSPLDRSVRHAHGGNDDGERTLEEIRERAEAIKELRRRD